MAKFGDERYNYKNIPRENIETRPVKERIKDYNDIHKTINEEKIQAQASRCQDCGIPFCHGFGCPLGNEIPDWNELVYRDNWQEALLLLHSTNNLPEITGRVCPAPCEEACTLNVGMEPVTIRDVELAIVEKGFKNQWIKPLINDKKTGKKVAVIGSGPAGLASAQNLTRSGHSVVLYERDDKIGGFLRYGIPDFKLEKHILDRRMEQMKAEGLEVKTGIYVGEDITAKELLNQYDAILLTNGCREPRDLQAKGRELKGIYFATDFLKQSNMRVAGISISPEQLIDTKDKRVIVIGGGDTGADCVGTSNRQGAISIHQIEILPKPPETRAEDTPWPMYAKKLRTSSSHEEGCERMWSILTKEVFGNGKVEGIKCVKVEWEKDSNGRWKMNEVAGSEFELKADIIFLAMGFVHPVHDKLLKDLGVEFTDRGNIKTDNIGFGKTNIDKVFAAGDAVRGPSLVVRAINDGRNVAKTIDEYLANK